MKINLITFNKQNVWRNFVGTKEVSYVNQVFENCFKLKNDDYDVNVNLSYLFAKTQDYKKSLIYSQEAIKLNDDRPEAIKILQNVYLILRILMRQKKIFLLLLISEEV